MNRDVPTLIPRKALFGNPEREQARISRDGSRIAFLAPLNGVLNVWVAPASAPQDARAVTSDAKRGIRFYVWTHNPDYLLYVQDSEGDEDWHIYAVNVASGDTKDLTPFEGVHATMFPMSPKFPNEALIGLNDRDARCHDVHRVNILTGETSLVMQNDIGAFGFVTDDDFRVRLAETTTESGGSSFLELSDSGEWLPFMKVGLEDGLTTYPLGTDVTGGTLYMADSRNRDTSALIELDMATREERVLAKDDRADASGFLVHPETQRVQAVAFEYERTLWRVLDDSIAADLERLRNADSGDFNVTGRSQDDSRWIVAYVKDDGPAAFHLYDRESGEIKFLFTNRPELEKYDLRPMESAIVKSRDGLDMVCYYTLPKGAEGTDGPGAPSNPLPAVLLVHGGPWGRDSWGYDAEHQLLANRGYAVISVNFRGSTGFGKAFVNAGDREWGGKMHDDLIDAVNWAIERGIADPERIAIMGGSYGGYAALVGLTFTPGIFACGVDIVGPSNLITTLETIPAYWEPMAEMEKARIGDISTEEGRRFLESRSPLSRADAITKPLLIAQGANDPRVKQAESDQIVEAMTERGIPVTYALFTDEGHGFARPENSLAFMAVAEAFLAEHLGGAHEPIGDAFEGSSIEIISGSDGAAGLSE